jgi:tetratricopeptide (TPR) repeat protein
VRSFSKPGVWRLEKRLRCMLLARLLIAAWLIPASMALLVRPTHGQDAAFKAGEQAVTSQRVDVQAAQGTVATLEAGTQVTIADVKNGWIGVAVEQNGKRIVGWVKPTALSQVRAAPESSAFQEGYAAHVRGEHARAIASYTEAIRIEPTNARAYNNRGLVYQAKGDMVRAIADYTEAMRLTPNLPAVYLNRAAAFAAMSEVDKALADYDEAIRIDPQSAKVYRLRATLYEAKGDKKKAAADRQQADKLYKPRYDTIAHRAIKIELEVKDKEFVPNYELLDSIIDDAKANIPVKASYSEEEATQIFRIIDAILVRRRFINVDQALLCDALVSRTITPQMVNSIDPRQLRFKVKAGDTIHCTESFPNSLIYASIGEVMGFPIRVALLPGHAFVRWWLTESAYVNWETTTGAVSTNSEYIAWKHVSTAAVKNGVYLAPLSRKSTLATVFFHVGLVWSGAWRGLENEYRDKDEITCQKKAIDTLNEAIALNRTYLDAYLQRASCWSRLKEYDKAIADASVAIQLDPEQPNGYFSRGVAYFIKGDEKKSADDIRKAIADLDKLVELQPQAPVGYYFRGLARLRTKELDKAMDDLNKAIELEPRFAKAYEARSKLWEGAGKGDKARDDMIKARSLQQQQR